MESFNYIYKKFFNLGVFSRVLLVIVKPLALWFSIQLDTDAGLAVAQIYILVYFLFLYQEPMLINRFIKYILALKNQPIAKM